MGNVMTERNEITLSGQGRLLKLETLGICGRKGGGKRGKVTAFSMSSRMRLLQRMATVNGSGLKSVFITLTYGQNFPNPRQAKRHLDSFLKRIKRRYENVSGYWRMEFQRRGAPHFHLILFNLPFVPKGIIKRAWSEIVGVQFWDTSTEKVHPPFTRIEFLRTYRRAVSYVSKYVAKVGDGISGFNIAAYLTDDGLFIHPQTGEVSESIGRYWGVFNEKCLPLAERVRITANGYSATVLDAFKRAIGALEWRVNPHTRQGFTLFHDNPILWVDYLEELLS